MGYRDHLITSLEQLQTLYDEARRYFDPVPIWTLPLRDDQVVGTEALRRLGHDLYGDRDPAASYRVTPPYQYALRRRDAQLFQQPDLDECHLQRQLRHQ